MKEEELTQLLDKAGLPTDGDRNGQLTSEMLRSVLMSVTDKAARLLANPRALLQENTESTQPAHEPTGPVPDAPVSAAPKGKAA